MTSIARASTTFDASPHRRVVSAATDDDAGDHETSRGRRIERQRAERHGTGAGQVDLIVDVVSAESV